MFILTILNAEVQWQYFAVALFFLFFALKYCRLATSFVVYFIGLNEMFLFMEFFLYGCFLRFFYNNDTFCWFFYSVGLFNKVFFLERLFSLEALKSLSLFRLTLDTAENFLLEFDLFANRLSSVFATTFPQLLVACNAEKLLYEVVVIRTLCITSTWNKFQYLHKSRFLTIYCIILLTNSNKKCILLETQMNSHWKRTKASFLGK